MITRIDARYYDSEVLREDPACKFMLDRRGPGGVDAWALRFIRIMQMMAFDRVEAEQIRQEAMKERMRRLLVAATADNGKVGIDVWSMDCDGVSGSHLRWIDPTVQAWEKLHDECYQWAEGPYSLTIVPPHELDAYLPQRQRDHALEAFEDGHQHVLFV